MELHILLKHGGFVERKLGRQVANPPLQSMGGKDH
jgi:hypothetical protein